MKTISKDAKRIKILAESEKLEDVIYELSDEEISQTIVQCFSTDEIINTLDERGELGEAFNEYIARKGAIDITAFLFKRASRKDKVAFFASVLNIPYLSTGEEYANALKNYLR